MLRRPNKTGRRRTIDLAFVLVVGAGEDGGAFTNSEAQSLAALAKDSHRPRVLWQLWRCRRGWGTVRGDPLLLVQAAIPGKRITRVPSRAPPRSGMASSASNMKFLLLSSSLSAHRTDSSTYPARLSLAART